MSLLRKIDNLPCISLLFNKFIVAGFKNRPNLQLLINTIWKLCQKKRQGRESRKHSDISGATKEIYKNFRQDLHSVMRDILQGPFEYKLGVRSTQSEIHFQANLHLSVAEVSSWTQTYSVILRSGACCDTHRLFRGLVSDFCTIGLYY